MLVMQICSRSATSILRKVSDRKSTRLNSSHSQISYAVFCLKKKKKTINETQQLVSTHILVTTCTLAMSYDTYRPPSCLSTHFIARRSTPHISDITLPMHTQY